MRRLLPLGIILGLLAALGGVVPAAAEQASSAERRVAAASIATGGSHTCVVSTAGDVRCWGNGGDGRLGYGNEEHIGDDETPASVGNVPLGGKAVAVTAGYDHTCALLTTGAVRCWGYGFYGQLGYGNQESVGDDETPASVGDVPVGGRVVAIAAGDFHTCALLATGKVRCWGEGAQGRLGYGSADHVGDDPSRPINADVPLGGTAVALTAGHAHTCALLTTGAVRCWGWAVVGQLGYGNTTNVGDTAGNTPAAAGDVPLGGAVTAVSATNYHTCALLTTGALRCWGNNADGQLGYGNTDTIGDNETPASVGNVPFGGTAIAVTTGLYHSCALLASGAVRCWGRGSEGQLGYGNTAHVGNVPGSTPAAAGNVSFGGVAVAIGAGGSGHTCVVLTTRAVRCWGDGSVGQLGYGNTSVIGDNESPASAGNVPVGALVRIQAAPRLRVKAGPKRDRRAPYKYRVRGKLTGSFVTDAATCAGPARIVVKRGKKTLAKKRTAIRPNCTLKPTRVVIKPRTLAKKRVRITNRTKLKVIVVAGPTGNRARAKRTRVVRAG